jgi:hypothetical protein
MYIHVQHIFMFMFMFIFKFKVNEHGLDSRTRTLTCIRTRALTTTLTLILTLTRTGHGHGHAHRPCACPPLPMSLQFHGGFRGYWVDEGTICLQDRDMINTNWEYLKLSSDKMSAQRTMSNNGGWWEHDRKITLSPRCLPLVPCRVLNGTFRDEVS